VPFKANAARRHRIPKQRHRVTNWAEYDAALRQRGSLTVWFTEEAVAAWRAEPRTTRGDQAHYSPLAIRAALTLRAVFRLALRQTEGLIGSILRLLGLDLAVPDHTTLSRRAETLEVSKPCPSSRGPVHLLVDSTGLRLCGPGEWLIEKHGTKRRRSWRKLHLGIDAETGQILASELTTSDVDDGSQVEPLLDQIAGPLASFTGDGAYDQAGVYGTVGKHHPDAEVIVPPRSTAVLSENGETAPTQRDRHLQSIAEHGRIGWQKASGYTRRALVESAIGRLKRVIGDALRSRTDWRRTTEVAIAIQALNRMLELGHPTAVRIAYAKAWGGLSTSTNRSVQHSLIDAYLSEQRYMVGETSTIMDMALWGWARMVPFILVRTPGRISRTSSVSLMRSALARPLRPLPR
jgi:DDE family transposase